MRHENGGGQRSWKLAYDGQSGFGFLLGSNLGVSGNCIVNCDGCDVEDGDVCDGLSKAAAEVAVHHLALSLFEIPAFMGMTLSDFRVLSKNSPDFGICYLIHGIYSLVLVTKLRLGNAY